MYWLRGTPTPGWIWFVALLICIMMGGWLLASHAFRLRSRERLLTGIALGFVVYIFFANAFAHWLHPSVAFPLGGASVLVCGLLAWLRKGGRLLDPRDLKVWPLILLLVSLVLTLTLIGRGVAIFDDRKNLSIISTMAAGDIPPHFYMNPDFVFNYHYGFQLLGSTLVRIGGFFPWSAFDLSKGVSTALALVLAGLWGFRVSHSRSWGVVTSLLVGFASGGRWMLNFLPQMMLRRMSVQVELWGASASTVNSLYEGLSSSWLIDGGPPLPMPFAYLNGILQPLILNMHKGPISLSLVILFLVLILLAKQRGWSGSIILGMVFAAWGLVAETEFILFGIGVACVLLSSAVRRGFQKQLALLDYRLTAASLIAGGAVTFFQGGTITEFSMGLLGLRPGGAAGGFEFRWPPAIVSAHLGELQLTSISETLVGLIELGPALLAGVLVLVCMKRWFVRDRIPEAALAAGSLFGFVLPVFLKYDVDRDITRMTAFALTGWILLAVTVLPVLFRRYRNEWLSIITAVWIGTLTFSGFVVAGSLITAIPRVTFSYHLADLDVHMTRIVWDALPEDALVLDSHAWRAVPVTGRLTRSFLDNTTELDSWLQHVSSSDAAAMAQAGFDYVYIDQTWWEAMSQERRASFSQECVDLVAEVMDTSETHFRRLYAVGACVDSSNG